ncbi:thiamine phosphate synthase [Rickettsiella endosymbiont of Aleochara curtula]|uniref:thiamine phosphate synthase n=1 Tax=Rickettsiella endosymbiont of Aleochara curtula TaxID=3077936 RepID=UPI00313C763B
MTIDYSYYLIADEAACAPLSIIDAVEQVITTGISCVQLRMKNQTPENIMRTGKQLLRLLRVRHIPLIINDHPDIALAIDADGVHIGQMDKAYTTVRQQLGSKKVIGLTIENIQQAQQCCHYDCDYFGVGPVFATATKKYATAPLGIANLKNINAALGAPVIAIGGINTQNLQSVLATGVAGVAMASAIFSASDPQLMSQKLAQTILQSRHVTA